MSQPPPEAPEHCPGPQSQMAGHADACQGCPNRQICQTAPKGPDIDLPQIKERLSTIKYKILVLSGKGGVGKSTFATTLAFGLAAADKQVGLLDIDICGPSVPKIAGAEGGSIHWSSLGWEPVYVSDNLAVMSIGFLLNSESDAVIWRGPNKNGLIKQFLRDVYWSDLDFLVVDTPPGTSDEHLSITQYLKASKIDGAIVITTPQEVALQDVRKEINFCKKVGIPVLGVVENMNGFVCPSCQNETKIFAPSTGGAEKMCKEFQIPFLGSIPLDPRVAKCCDDGVSFIDKYPDSPASKIYLEIIDNVVKSLVDGNSPKYS